VTLDTVQGIKATNGPTFKNLLLQRGDGHGLLILNQTTPATYNVDLEFQDNGTSRWLFTVRVTDNDDLWIYNVSRASFDFKISASDGGIHIPNVKKGTNQANAGAVAGEIWMDTDDVTLRLGV